MAKSEQSLVEIIKREIDEIRLQLNLGQKEAAEHLENHKGKFGKIVDETIDRVQKTPLIDDEKTSKLKQKLDELNLQLKLGAMETRDIAEEQTSKISEAIDGFIAEYGPLEKNTQELIEEVGDLFENGSEIFKSKLDAFRLNLGLGAIHTGDELSHQKDEFDERLSSLSSKAQGVGEHLSNELSLTFAQIKRELHEFLESHSNDNDSKNDPV